MPKIILDPGHVKGYNKGAVAGYCEGTAMYHYANRLAEKLRAAGVTVEITRGLNENPSLTARGKKAKGADMFVSLHSNAASAKSAHGVTVFYSIKRSGDKPHAATLAKELAKIINGGTRNRGACTRKGGGDWDYYTVIQYAAKVNCPHVFLIEHGFHSNTEECTWLMKDVNLENMAELECKLLCDILNVKVSEGNKTQAVNKLLCKKQVNTPGDTLNVRKEANHKATKLGELKHESIVEIYEIASNGWMRIKQGTLTGWVNGGFLTDIKGYKVRITAKSLNVRKGAGTNHDITAVVHKGEVYTITDETLNGSTKWGKLESGKGWISLNPKYTETL